MVKIVERISDDLYKFRDASGVVNVDIDHKRWNGVTVGPQDTVEIQGEVDKDWNSVEIDVKQIRKNHAITPAPECARSVRNRYPSLWQSVSRGGDDERY